MTTQETLPLESLLFRADTVRRALPVALIWAVGIALAMLTLSELMRFGAFSRVDSFVDRHITIGVFILVDLAWTLRVGRRVFG